MTAPISQQQDAHRYSTRDRVSTANLLLNNACRTAIDLLRIGQRNDMDVSESVAHHLLLAGQRADRVLGRGEAS